MKGELTIKYEWFSLPKDIALGDKHALIGDAIDHALHMRQEGYIECELLSHVNDKEVSGWWSISTNEEY